MTTPTTATEAATLALAQQVIDFINDELAKRVIGGVRIRMGDMAAEVLAPTLAPLVARAEAADRLAEALTKRAALAAPAPETGEREAEKVSRSETITSLLWWAALNWLRHDDVSDTCKFCNKEAIHTKSKWVCQHESNCLHIRAAAITKSLNGVIEE